MFPQDSRLGLEPEKFRNYYRCPCGEKWNSTWSCTCNEKCPRCNREIEPSRSEELCLECGQIVDFATDGLCPNAANRSKTVVNCRGSWPPVRPINGLSRLNAIP